MAKMTRKVKPWFRAKRYGYGWGLPLTWQGWAVFIAYIAFIIWDFTRIDKYSQSASDTIRPFLVEVVFATIVLIAICYLTSGKPQWRWGDKRK